MSDYLNELQAVIDVHCRNGYWNYNAYTLGMTNGLITAKSIFTGDDPKYLDAPDEWLADRLHRSLPLPATKGERK